MSSGFFDSVYEVVKQIPKGKVASYGQIARLIGRPQSSRYVGYALHSNPSQQDIPCHRVVNKQGYLAGSFAFGGSDAQKNLLLLEGVFVDENNCVNMRKFGWKA